MTTKTIKLQPVSAATISLLEDIGIELLNSKGAPIGIRELVRLMYIVCTPLEDIIVQISSGGFDAAVMRFAHQIPPMELPDLGEKVIAHLLAEITKKSPPNPPPTQSGQPIPSQEPTPASSASP